MHGLACPICLFQLALVRGQAVFSSPGARGCLVPPQCGALWHTPQLQAPTEVLADQHARNIEALLHAMNAKVSAEGGRGA